MPLETELPKPKEVGVPNVIVPLVHNSYYFHIRIGEAIGMGRKNRVGCSYCLGSKLNDVEFELILWGWIAGDSASETAYVIEDFHRVAKITPIKRKSEKTINDYYGRLGIRAFKLLGENSLKQLHLADANEHDEEVDFENFLERLHYLIIDTDSLIYDWDSAREMRNNVSPETNGWDFMAIMLEYRQASIMKNGVYSRIRETLGWAMFREDTRAYLRSPETKITEFTLEHIEHSMDALKAYYLQYPLMPDE